MLVGLGNPGPKYADTRHNVGFMALDLLAERHGLAWGKKRFQALGAQGSVDGNRVVLLKPQTFMNCSGDSVGPAAGFFRVPPTQIVVLHDDMDLPSGRLKLKVGGGHGGHNGLRSLAERLGSPGFARVRLGIGRPPPPMDPAAYVLQRFSGDEASRLPELLSTAVDAVEMLLDKGPAKAMNHYNGGGSPGQDTGRDGRSKE